MRRKEIKMTYLCDASCLAPGSMGKSILIEKWGGKGG